MKRSDLSMSYHPDKKLLCGLCLLKLGGRDYLKVAMTEPWLNRGLSDLAAGAHRESDLF